MALRSSMGAALVACICAAPSIAHAYCFSTTCEDQPFCGAPPEEATGPCIPLRWKNGCAGFTVASGGSLKLGISADELHDVVKTAFSQWTHADCGGDNPGIRVVDMGEVGCGRAEYSRGVGAGNANVILFVDTDWPHESFKIAVTTTSYDPDTGELLDVDMELNAEDFVLTLGDDEIDTDLLSTITHETGHYLGLAHSDEPTQTATMYMNYIGVDGRSLEPDDVTAICLRYPPATDPGPSCNPLGPHGFSGECREEQTEGQCAMSTEHPARSDRSMLWGVMAVMGIGIVGRRRRSTKY